MEPSPAMKIIVGLGNPGLQYRRTRHNFGFMVVDALAKQREIRFTRGRSRCMHAEGQLGKERVLLVKPLTYMNDSGACVAAVAHYHKVELSDLLVICDDVNLPLGKMRLRRGGSAGGHNGLESIIKHLGRQDFPRLRLGVGQPPEWMDMMSYVLGAFPRSEAKLVEATVARATLAAETWVYHGVDEAMNRFNP
jgi:peptidyl-tRNA hydrolase, PTH1 family